MKSSSFYPLEYIKILKFSQEHTTYSDHSSTSAHPLSVTESLPKLACNKSQPFFESVCVSICWALVLHIWKCLIFPISIYHVPLSPSVLPAKYKIFWENGLSLGWPGPRGGRWCGREIAVRRPRRSLELGGRSIFLPWSRARWAGSCCSGCWCSARCWRSWCSYCASYGPTRTSPCCGPSGRGDDQVRTCCRLSALGARVPCGRISAAPAFLRVAWSFRAARLRLSQGLWFGVEGAGAFCLPSWSLRTCLLLAEVKEPWNRRERLQVSEFSAWLPGILKQRGRAVLGETVRL